MSVVQSLAEGTHVTISFWLVRGGGVYVFCGRRAVGGPVNDGLKIPNFDHWYLVNSMLVTKETPRSAAAGLCI